MNRLARIVRVGSEFRKIGQIRLLSSDQEEAESSLSKKLAKPGGREMVQRVKKLGQYRDKNEDSPLDKEMSEQVDLVADSFGENKEDIKRELTEKLVDQELETLKSARQPVQEENVLSLISDMKLELSTTTDRKNKQKRRRQ